MSYRCSTTGVWNHDCPCPRHRKQEKCGFCFDGEIGFPPDADECPYCNGTGFVQGTPPRFVPDTREEERGDA